MYCDFGIFSYGDYPPNDVFFSCLRFKKTAVITIEERGQRPFSLPAFVHFKPYDNKSSVLLFLVAHTALFRKDI